MPPNIFTTPIRIPKTCGVIEEDKAYGIKKIAEPIGVIAAVIPTTNPTSTAIFKTLIALKDPQRHYHQPPSRAQRKAPLRLPRWSWKRPWRQAHLRVLSPGSTFRLLEMTNLVMKEADIILATGGPGMVKAAYSSGKPAVGVGAGNTPAIIDETADIALGRQLHHSFQDL